MWLTTELLHKSKNYRAKSDLTVIGVLKKIDVSTIFFFLGILLAVASLQSMGHLNDMAVILDNTFDGNIYAINIIIGLLSAIVDNVPLVAGAMGMYEMGTGVFAVDGTFLGILGLLCWNWWQCPYNRFCCWCSRNGYSKNRLHLVCQKNKFSCIHRIYCWCYNLHTNAIRHYGLTLSKKY